MELIHDINADINEIGFKLDGPYVEYAKRVMVQGIRIWREDKYDEFSIPGFLLVAFMHWLHLCKKILTKMPNY